MTQDGEALSDSLGYVRQYREAAIEPDVKMCQSLRCRLNGITT